MLNRGVEELVVSFRHGGIVAVRGQGARKFLRQRERGFPRSAVAFGGWLEDFPSMRKLPFSVVVLSGLVFAGCTSHAPISHPTSSLTQVTDKPGYTNTPFLPNLPWRVHDPDRPVPRVVTPGKTFSQGAPPPSDAVVLFDGSDLSKWSGTNGEPRWKVENGYMEAVKKTGDIHTKDEFGDFQLHLEFATPAAVKGDSQDRGNSGLKIYGQYEVQILDSFENATYPDGQCGALYGQWPPLVNASARPGEWQSYVIIFETARWGENHKLIKPACVTVIHNGVLLHHKKEFMGATKHRLLPVYTEHPPCGPIVLQEHNNPVRFRNIWIRNLAEGDRP
jgi:Domain of Unknown Function (DUF1080)